MKLPGLNSLTETQKKAIIRDTVGVGNIAPLPESLNSSKLNKTDGKWTTFRKEPLNPNYIRDLRRKQDILKNKIQDQIDKFNNES